MKTSIPKKSGLFVALFFCLVPVGRCTLNDPPESFLRELLLLRPCVPALLSGDIQGCPLNLTGRVSTFAGDGTNSYLDATGTAAQFSSGLFVITTDGTFLYGADSGNRRIRKIEIATGIVTTLAGDGTSGVLDAIGTAAQFNNPLGITTDGINVYIADTGNHRIRKIEITTGIVTTLAGSTSGYLDATGTAAQFNGPRGVATDGKNVYVADTQNHRIRKIEIASGIVTTLAGDGSAGYLDGTGTAARLNSPFHLTTDGTDVFVADYSNHRIRKIEIATGIVTTLAGDGTAAYLDDTGIAAQFNNPYGLAVGGAHLYVGDNTNNRIRKIEIATGVVTTLAGDGTAAYLDDTGIAARFSGPRGITTDGIRLFVSDPGNRRIRKIE